MSIIGESIICWAHVTSLTCNARSVKKFLHVLIFCIQVTRRKLESENSYWRRDSNPLPSKILVPFAALPNRIRPFPWLHTIGRLHVVSIIRDHFVVVDIRLSGTQYRLTQSITRSSMTVSHPSDILALLFFARIAVLYSYFKPRWRQFKSELDREFS